MRGILFFKVDFLFKICFNEIFQRFSTAVYESINKKDATNGRKVKFSLFKHRKSFFSVKNNCFTVCALGGKDRSISVWSTAFLRPVVVLNNIFVGNVMDLSWYKCFNNCLMRNNF